MSPRTNSTVLTTRDAVAHLLNHTDGVMTWPVRLALSSAFNYLDDALPTLAPPLLPPDVYAGPSHRLLRVEGVGGYPKCAVWVNACGRYLSLPTMSALLGGA